MRDIAAKISEHYTDYVLIVRKNNIVTWRYSEGCFALGACERLRNSVSELDKPPTLVQIIGEGE